MNPTQTPMLVYPTLHYQNGGVVIDGNGATNVPGLYCVGEVAGGIHGRNRLMGNALLEIISFGRRAGAEAVANAPVRGHKKITLDHVSKLRRELTRAGLPIEIKGPLLFPEYAGFDTDINYTGVKDDMLRIGLTE